MKVKKAVNKVWLANLEKDIMVVVMNSVDKNSGRVFRQNG